LKEVSKVSGAFTHSLGDSILLARPRIFYTTRC
jgi:hypothetical protein